MFLQKQIYDTLTHIYKETFPEENIKNFKLELDLKESTTFNGDYNPNNYTIRAVNFSRPTAEILCTTIHELSHHCEFCMYGNTGHSKRFYEVYKQLIEKAISLRYIKYENIKDKWDITKLEKKVGKINSIICENIEEDYVIKVSNCYSIKNDLKSRGYLYSPLEQKWCKKISIKDKRVELNFLKDKINISNIECLAFNDIKIDAIYYLVIKGAYDIKDMLKSNGYKFNSFGFADKNVWVKKIFAKELKKEEEFLKENNINYKITNRCKQSNK